MMEASRRFGSAIEDRYYFDLVGFMRLEAKPSRGGMCIYIKGFHWRESRYFCLVVKFLGEPRARSEARRATRIRICDLRGR
jgi:hypothetical protein